MTTHKIITLTISVALALAATIAFAQQAATPAQTAVFETKWMHDNLRITDAQGKKIYSIVSHFAQLDQAEGSNKKANARTKDADIRAILTADQYRTYHQRINELHQQEMQSVQQPAK